MFTSENVLSAEFINENSIKVTHKDSDNVLVTTIQKNPRKEAYKSLISSGWTLKKIKERTKELQKIADPNVRRLEVIANGYSWAISQLEDKQAQFDDLKSQLKDVYQEQQQASKNLESLYQEQKDVMTNLQDLYQEQQQAARTLNDLYSESQAAQQNLAELYNEQKESANTLSELYSESQAAQQNLAELYDEQKTATGTLKELYNEHETAQSHLAELYTEKEVAEIRMKESQKDVDVRMQKLRDKLERNKDKLQKNYEQYQELYGMNITDSLLDDDKNFDKELVFKLKLEILADERFKTKEKEIKSQIRKSKTCRQLMKIALEALEE